MCPETLAKMGNENVETNHHHGDHLRFFAAKNGAAKRAQVVTVYLKSQSSTKL